ncbi:MAG: lytic transglycosylase domain-containing protein [Nitrosomonas sp.]|uniref:Transglycosylase SLT domain-containing protein n=1 Tax=Nitrosomonas aestuarii TaxID=52441 RepID=A0A1I4DM66_9PROT|nr:lytic transglycosylase domain-containing protein [Nitrosomonas aestuarii]MBX3630307.1 lytic transglycosylase domain-containing protein [Nitrosomonas sp.]SFK93437.1 Transglycosylase SLT domain-containing protein [Nitrosomonas aestuarii]
MKTLWGIILLLPVSLQAACFEEAAARYKLNPELLKAISRVESNGNPNAINRSNKNGSHDIGHMQINSRWLPTLKTYGITEQSLFDPCINTHVGAWVLAGNIQRMGYSWDAIGAYNARSPDKRRLYAKKVVNALRLMGAY